MNKFIIGTISNLDRPMNPAAKGQPLIESVYEPDYRRDDPQGKRTDPGCTAGGYPWTGNSTGGGIGSRRIVCDRKRGEDRRSEGNVWRDQDTLKYWDEKKKEQR